MIREWDIKRTTFSVGDFLSWQKAGALELSPSFQRRSVWTKAQKSYFVDTVYRGLPVPIVFVRERTDVETLLTIREIVDGQQRLRTMLSFVDPSSLKDAGEADNFLVQRKHNREIEGKPFAELNADAKKRILSYQISTHVLPNDTGDSEVLSIFARMNSTGSRLNDQELRNAEYFGEFKIASYDTAFANLPRWRKWGLFNENDIARMKEVEFTSQLFILIMQGLYERTQGVLARYYKTYDDEFADRQRVIKEFKRVMDIIEDTFGEGVRSTIFRNTAMFFQLFNLIRRLEEAGISLTQGRVRRVSELGEKIRDRSGLPEGVLVALASRFNRLSNQEVVANYLFTHAAA